MDNSFPVNKLPLLRDYDADSWEKFNRASEICRATFGVRGYTRVDTPIIELTELFLRKSGGELAAQLYSFTDPGGYEVSLRPEFTAPVIRHAVESGALADLPRRYEYSGPVFRYPVPAAYDNGLAGSFTQTGAELIGVVGPSADGEIIGMARAGLIALGVSKPGIVIGHVGLIRDLLLSLSLSERARLFLLTCVGALSRGETGLVRERAAEMGLLPARADDSGRPEIAGRQASADQIETVLGHSLGDAFRGSVGSRNPEDILSRLAMKMRSTDDPSAVDAALGLVAALATVKGSPEEAMERGREIIAGNSQDPAPVAYLESVVDAAVAEGVPIESITVDLGLAREIAYYTGAVFDLTGPGGEKLGGGGRYDGLVRALGGEEDIPALGFAYNTDAVLKTVESGG